MQERGTQDRIADLRTLSAHLRRFSLFPEDAEAIDWAIQKIESLEKVETEHPRYCVNCGHVEIVRKSPKLGLPTLAIGPKLVVREEIEKTA